MTSGRDLDSEIVLPTEKKNINFDMLDKLFYDYHSECESIIMDMVADKIDRKTLDTVFADLDELQEKYHDRLSDLYRER